MHPVALLLVRVRNSELYRKTDELKASNVCIFKTKLMCLGLYFFFLLVAWDYPQLRTIHDTSIHKQLLIWFKSECFLKYGLFSKVTITLIFKRCHQIDVKLGPQIQITETERLPSILFKRSMLGIYLCTDGLFLWKACSRFTFDEA